MLHTSPFSSRSSSSSSNSSSSSSGSPSSSAGRRGRDRQEGVTLSFILILVSLLRLVKLPFRPRRFHTMSTKSLLPTYQDQAVASVNGGGRSGRHPYDNKHEKAAHHHHHIHTSPSRRKKSRWCCCGAPRLRHIIFFLLTLFFIFYVTDCLHLYKRISLKKESGATHLQTTTWNFRFSRGPIDFSMGTFRTRDFVEINIAPMD